MLIVKIPFHLFSDFFLFSIKIVKPKDLKIEPKPTVIKAKEKLILTCKCLNGRQPAQLLWFRGNQQIENENLIQTELDNENRLISKLIWTVASEDNEKKLSCKVRNSRFANFSLEDSLVLNVQCKYYFLKLIKFKLF